MLAPPGKYTVTLAKRVDGVLTPLPGSQTFDVVPEGVSTRENRLALAAAEQSATESRARLDAIKRAIDATPALPPKLREATRSVEKRLGEITRALRGDSVMRTRNEPTRASISERVSAVAGSLRQTSGASSFSWRLQSAPPPWPLPLSDRFSLCPAWGWTRRSRSCLFGGPTAWRSVWLSWPHNSAGEMSGRV